MNIFGVHFEWTSWTDREKDGRYRRLPFVMNEREEPRQLLFLSTGPEQPWSDEDHAVDATESRQCHEDRDNPAPRTEHSDAERLCIK